MERSRESVLRAKYEELVNPTLQGSVQVCLASVMQKGEDPEFRKITMGASLAEDFLEIAKNVLEKRKTYYNAGNTLVRDYNVESIVGKHEVEYLNFNDQQELGGHVSALADLNQISPFSENEDDFIANLKFYVIVVKPSGGESVYFFRTYSPKKELAHSMKLAIVFQGDSYSKFNDNLFIFDEKIDCVVAGNDLFIFQKENFQKIFNFFELLRSKARETLATIEQHIKVDDFQAFSDTCQGNVMILKKLKNIASKPYLANVTMADIKKVIRDFGLSVTIVGTGSDEKIHFDPADKWAILKLLDDDYLKSGMTGENYEVNSKRPLS